MNKTATKIPTWTATFVVDPKARLAARKRAYGAWKGHARAMITENRSVRKEWDKRIKKLGS